MIKKLALFTGMIALVIAISGCQATAAVGKSANPPWLSGSVTKDGVKFSTAGDIGDANIMCRQNASDEKENMISMWSKYCLVAMRLGRKFQ